MSGSTGQAPKRLPIAECRLDLDGARGQRDRYRELGRHARGVELRDGGLEVRFGPGLDPGLLDETIAVERDCCPFFRLDYDPSSRRLTVAVETPEQEPALEAIAQALAG